LNIDRDGPVEEERGGVDRHRDSEDRKEHARHHGDGHEAAINLADDAMSDGGRPLMHGHDCRRSATAAWETPDLVPIMLA
jgi:hypothetical protein